MLIARLERCDLRLSKFWTAILLILELAITFSYEIFYDKYENRSGTFSWSLLFEKDLADTKERVLQRVFSNNVHKRHCVYNTPRRSEIQNNVIFMSFDIILIESRSKHDISYHNLVNMTSNWHYFDFLFSLRQCTTNVLSNYDTQSYTARKLSSTVSSLHEYHFYDFYIWYHLFFYRHNRSAIFNKK